MCTCLFMYNCLKLRHSFISNRDQSVTVTLKPRKQTNNVQRVRGTCIPNI